MRCNWSCVSDRYGRCVYGFEFFAHSQSVILHKISKRERQKNDFFLYLVFWNQSKYPKNLLVKNIFAFPSAKSAVGNFIHCNEYASFAGEYGEQEYGGWWPYDLVFKSSNILARLCVCLPFSWGLTTFFDCSYWTGIDFDSIPSYIRAINIDSFQCRCSFRTAGERKISSWNRILSNINRKMNDQSTRNHWKWLLFRTLLIQRNQLVGYSTRRIIYLCLKCKSSRSISCFDSLQRRFRTKSCFERGEKFLTIHSSKRFDHFRMHKLYRSSLSTGKCFETENVRVWCLHFFPKGIFHHFLRS